MFCPSIENARVRAERNAQFFNRAYCVFFDTNQNARCEPYASQIDPLAIYHPDGTVEDNYPNRERKE